ncbi:hypothetical protein BT96DRAFT_971694 [Gymnopus androsaceus JB14]|uniref:C2H2-type domain-containing protein n=1 Tax=Gymnopus androsaceus JB14 TaxID=1447944 RepID=A0A6A4IBK1_9AGAR|nr:hypothetical protein BT96DRAFT_971694 [Gymnopus androsaceus JB14]
MISTSVYFPNGIEDPSFVSSKTAQGTDNLELLLPDFDDGIQLQFSRQLQPDWQAQEETRLIPPSLNHRPIPGQAVNPTPPQYGITWAAPSSISEPFSPLYELGSQWYSVSQAAEATASQHDLAPPPSNFTQSSRSVSPPLSPIPSSSKRAGPGSNCPECGGRLRSKQSLRNHIEAKHKKNKPNTCVHCKAKFSYHQSWRRHDRKSRCPVIHGQARASPT